MPYLPMRGRFVQTAGVPPVFHIYVLFLILGQRPARRIWNALFGAAFTSYGLYLLLFFGGGHYLFFYYVFILPILMIVQFFRDRSAYQARQQAIGFQAPPPPSPGYGQWAGTDQPSEKQPPAQ